MAEHYGAPVPVAAVAVANRFVPRARPWHTGAAAYGREARPLSTVSPQELSSRTQTSTPWLRNSGAAQIGHAATDRGGCRRPRHHNIPQGIRTGRSRSTICRFSIRRSCSSHLFRASVSGFLWALFVYRPPFSKRVHPGISSGLRAPYGDTFATIPRRRGPFFASDATPSRFIAYRPGARGFTPPTRPPERPGAGHPLLPVGLRGHRGGRRGAVAAASTRAICAANLPCFIPPAHANERKTVPQAIKPEKKYSRHEKLKGDKKRRLEGGRRSAPKRRAEKPAT